MEHFDFEEDRSERKVAYFSMEVAIDVAIPTYSGGLGVLAADTLRSAADLCVPMVGVTLLQRKGYFRQRLSSDGAQSEEPEDWLPDSWMEFLGPVTSIAIEGRKVAISVWVYPVHSRTSGHTVPLYFLDSWQLDNEPIDRDLTGRLYGGDERYRLAQEILLGVGGHAVLRALGYTKLQTFHMNEGHSALLALGLLEEEMSGGKANTFNDAHLEAVRRKCVFTTHTPVPAGHDRFPPDLVHRLLGVEQSRLLDIAGCFHDGYLNMTYLALRCSHYINGVAMHHGEVSRSMFPGYPISAITNGVHAATWAAPAFRDLYDRHIKEWRGDNLYLRYAASIPIEEIAESHRASKHALISAIKAHTGQRLDETALTIGFGRRAATYKRPDLLFSDIERLHKISKEIGPIQVIFGGKAHPFDGAGKDTIRKVYEAAAFLSRDLPVIYVENYDLRWAQLFVSGVDLWLNTPQRPNEASGTSGMKAAMNGVPSLSVLDGWWIEGCIEGVTGWSIGEPAASSDPAVETQSLYGKLEWLILPMFYNRPKTYLNMMRSVIALNASFFNTQRMLSQYIVNAYDLDHGGDSAKSKAAVVPLTKHAPVAVP